MEYKQIEFNFETHSFENNIESAETLEICNDSFKGQNKKLFDLLMDGKRITFLEAISDYGISDIRSRSRDLTKNKVRFHKEFIPGTRSKVWYMDADDKTYNQIFYK